MFDFNTKWDVDCASESLNTSLFGKSKIRKVKDADFSLPVTNKHHSSFIIHDSDDEQFSKKDKKKLKSRRRKENKQGSVKKEATSGKQERNSPVVLESRTDRNQNGKKVSRKTIELPANQVMQAKPPKKKKQKKLKEIEISMDSFRKTIVPSANQVMQAELPKKKKVKEFEISNDRTAQPEENISRKRKISSPENVRKAKKVKVGDSTTLSETSLAEGGKKKRKRNIKKKNSKKNKYKHLALNSNMNTVDSSISEVATANSPSKDNKKLESGQSVSKTLVMQKEAKNLSFNKNKLEDNSLSVKLLYNFSEKKTNSNKNAQSTFGKSSSTHGQKLEKSDENENSLKPHVSKKKRSKDKKIKSCERIESLKDVPELKTQDTPCEASPSLSQSPKLNTNFGPAHHDSPASKVSKQFKLKQEKLLKMLHQTKISHEGKQRKSKKKKQILPEPEAIHNTSGASSVLQKFSPKQAAFQPTSAGSIKKTVFSSRELETSTSSVEPRTATLSLWGKAAELGRQAQDKLNAARFRYLNEQLYTCQGQEAKKLFKEDPVAFSVYHDGYEHQVSKWPVNPLNVIIKQMKDKPANLVVADLGCGDAKLAESIPQKVHSFDLVALNERVTACDMSKLPLANEKVDIAVFCLSLMGTNLSDYIHEANRILKTGGLLKIAEVVSRFSGLSRFTEGVCSHGFQLLNKRDLSQMFYMMDFKKVKTLKKTAGRADIKLKPCIYKKR